MKRQGLDSLAAVIGPDAAMAAMIWFHEQVTIDCDTRDRADEIAREHGLKEPSAAEMAMFKAASDSLRDLVDYWAHELRCEIAGGES